MGHVIDADYRQQFLLPPCLEDWVGAGHPARFIREFVDALDLDAVGIRWAAGEGGRPAYARGLLVKVWLYGYFQRIRSTRKLEQACRDNVGLMWLTGLQQPDHNTLSAFFRANKEGLRALFRQTVAVAAQADLVGFVLHALDGTKLAAQVGNRTGWHKERLEELLEKLDARIAALEAELEQNDAMPGVSDELPQGLAQREALRERVRAALGELEAAGQAHLHPADRDARVMKCQDRNRNTFGYNAQAVADDRANLVVACEVVQDCNDEGQLNAMVDCVVAQAGQAAERTVADTGYATGPELAHAEQEERDVVVALPAAMRPNPDAPFHASNFTYDGQRNCCICPKGGILTYRSTRPHRAKGYLLRVYRCTAKGCPHRAACTKGKKARTIELNQYYEAVVGQRQKHQDPRARADLAKRCYLIEPVFAFIKQHLGFRRFTVKGLANVRAQWALLCATYNLHQLYRRWREGGCCLNPLPGALPTPSATTA